MKTIFNIRNLMVTALMLLSLTASAAIIEETIGNFQYQLNTTNSQATVTGGSGNDITIPSTVTGSDGKTYTVTSIAERAFCYQTGITSLTLPSTVTTIREEAFAYCTSLQTLELNVNTIGLRAFKGCSGLNTLTLGVNTSISRGAFQDCCSLKNTTITALPTNSKVAFRPCFQNCTGTLNISVDAWPTMTEADKHLLSESCFSTINFNASKCAGFVAMNNPELRTVNIGASGYSATAPTAALTSGCPRLKEINVAQGHSTLRSADGVVYYRTGIVFFPEALGYYKVPEGVTNLAQSVFDGQIPCVFDCRGCKKAPAAANTNNVPFLTIAYRGSLFSSSPLPILTVENIYGDVNGDGDVNMTDLNAVINDVLKDQKH